MLQLCVVWVGRRGDLNLAVRCKPMSDHGVGHSIALFLHAPGLQATCNASAPAAIAADTPTCRTRHLACNL